MPARKTTKKAARGGSPIRPLYAVPIYDCIKRGDPAEMKKLAAQARKHISDVTAAVAALEKKLAGKKR
jgi:hypothetical protein